MFTVMNYYSWAIYQLLNKNLIRIIVHHCKHYFKLIKPWMPGKPTTLLPFFTLNIQWTCIWHYRPPCHHVSIHTTLRINASRPTYNIKAFVLLGIIGMYLVGVWTYLKSHFKKLCVISIYPKMLPLQASFFIINYYSFTLALAPHPKSTNVCYDIN